MEYLSPEELSSFGQIRHDEHGHVRLAEINLGEAIRDRLRARLAGLGISTTVVAKDIGYELRCADPIPLDMEYTRDLGYCAASFLLGGGKNAMVALVDGHFKSLPFADMLDPATGRTRVRLVDVGSEHYKIARRYMVRLRRSDFEDAQSVTRLAAAAGLSEDEFRRQFEYVVENETAPLQLGRGS
jgi:6-phosphofructokinase 1